MRERPGLRLEPVELEAARKQASAETGGLAIDDEDLNGYLMYPKIYVDYSNRHREYGPVRVLPTRTFFYGMEPAEEITAEIDPGKIVEIRLQAVGETNQDGDVRVFFELNGQPRVVRVPDRKIKSAAEKKPKAHPDNPSHVGAPMPGQVASILVSPGQQVRKGDLLLTIEAMKMETGIYAEQNGKIKSVHVQAGKRDRFKRPAY